MTAMEASQRAVLFMMETLGAEPAPKKRRRNRGAARRVKIAGRRHRLQTESYGQI